MILEGKEKVLSYLQKQLDRANNGLERYICGIEDEFSTLVISGILDILPRKIQRTEETSKRRMLLIELHDTVMVLDSLLERNLFKPSKSYLKSTKIILHDPEKLFYAKAALHTFRPQISPLKSLIHQCKESNHFKIEIDSNGTPSFGTISNRDSYSEWFVEKGTNLDWFNHFFETHSLVEHFDEISYMLFSSFGMSLETITKIENEFMKIEYTGRDIGRSFTLLRKEEYLTSIFEHIPSYEWIGVLDHLTYNPGSNPASCIYYPISGEDEFSYMFGKPPISLTSVWLSKIINTGGKLKTEYGECFNDFVKQRIETQTNLNVDFTEIDFQGIDEESIEKLKYYRRERIKIDILASNKDTLYVISCKAHDFFIDIELEANLMFIPYSDFYKRVLDNKADRIEVLEWADIVSSSETRLKQLGLEGKMILPVLVTSQREPLQLDTVKEWFSEFEELPNCLQLSIEDFEQFFG